jgi:signal transduction histidine kinase
LQLILRNLVENALRHGDAEPMRIDARAARGRHGVEIRLRDHGRGYAGDPAELGRLFLRGDASRGTGVGLYLVRVLMERMGGSVAFANADGGGFVVTLVFPTDS